eukprot:Rmarinus@m.27852
MVLVMEPSEPSVAYSEPLWRINEQLSLKDGKRHTVYNPVSKRENYTGCWKDNMRDGMGVQTWKNGYEYNGEWKRNFRHGHGTLWKTVGGEKRRVYEGGWKNGLKDGRGILSLPDGSRYEGEFKAGVRHGRGKMEYTTSSIVQKDDAVAYRNGDVYSGEWVNDNRHGFGVLICPNGDRYEGMWRNDKKEGPGTYYYFDTRKRYDGEWYQDVAKCGSLSEIDPNGEHFPDLGLANVDEMLSQRIMDLRYLSEHGENQNRAPVDADEALFGF